MSCPACGTDCTYCGTPQIAAPDVDDILRSAKNIPSPDAMMDERSKLEYWKRLQRAIAESKYIKTL